MPVPSLVSSAMALDRALDSLTAKRAEAQWAHAFAEAGREPLDLQSVPRIGQVRQTGPSGPARPGAGRGGGKLRNVEHFDPVSASGADALPGEA
jgi:hypothetical protein